MVDFHLTEKKWSGRDDSAPRNVTADSIFSCRPTERLSIQYPVSAKLPFLQLRRRLSASAGLLMSFAPLSSSVAGIISHGQSFVNQQMALIFYIVFPVFLLIENAHPFMQCRHTAQRFFALPLLLPYGIFQIRKGITHKQIRIKDTG